MLESNSKNLDFLLDVSQVKDKDLQTRMRHFEEKAEILGFTKIEIPSCNTRSVNEHIQNLTFEKVRNTFLLGVYFFHLTNQSAVKKDDWNNFRTNKKISPWNDHVVEAENILYIGQRHNDLKTRLCDHTVKANYSTQALKLNDPSCPNFSYSITLYYQRIDKTKKATSKIYCLLLETIAKELFPTLIGK
ncbi:hypothetical protein HLH17_14545 [Acinetobacter sp. ANC 5380]|uniref:Uncharacterized protein n=1 Tax=Acinetobacter terrae TaxID=2731247 RepID=A0A7Y2RHE3_9GAMM|nr:hypothetical protein [Acinetobacter terrae]NNH78841.1 hypothetical protein [Acinetobacter terrae]